MKQFSKILGALTPALLGRSAVVALSLLLLPILFLQVPETAKTQTIDTAWRDLGVQFVASNGIIPKPAVATPFDVAQLETFTHDHIDLALANITELNCLTTAIYYEARSEPVAGQLAVAQVVINRTKSKHYPASICEVVYEGSERTTGCQFSFTCDGSLAKAPTDKIWQRSRQSAVHAMLDITGVTIGRATHYHTVAVNPHWSSSLLKTADVGSHIFYRFPNRREKKALFANGI